MAARALRLLLVLCLAVAPTTAFAQDAEPEPEAEEEAPTTGEVEPDEERWGDEWFDEEAKQRAAAEERRVREQFGVGVAKPPPAATAKPPEPAKAAAGQTPPDAAAAEPPAAVGIDPALQGKAAQELARPIEPPTRTVVELEAAWRARREALLRQDSKEAAAQAAKVTDILQELDIAEVHAFGVAAVRESRKLEGVSAPDSVARAELAVALAPSLPATHLQLARARFAADLADVAAWAPPARRAIAALFREPRYVRPVVADAFVALAAALLAAGAAIVLLLFAKSARYFFHDFHHVFPRGASRLQTALLAVIVLALPVVFRLGPFAIGAALVAASWLYLERAEKAVAASWLLLLGGMPIASAAVAEATSWDGTPAEALYAVERAGDFSQLPLLEEATRSSSAPPETLFAVARAVKRTGDPPMARAVLERAGEMRPRWAAAQVNLGNVRFLQGDLDAAEALYTKAIDAEPGLAAAYFNLSRVHYRRVNFNLGQETRTKALDLDRTLLDRYATGEREDQNPRANVYLLDVALPAAELAGLARAAASPEHVAAQVASRLFGPLPTGAAPWAPVALVGVLGLLALLADRVRSSHGCTKCGRPVCLRCDPETSGGNLCGQCVNVFARKAAVDPTAKVQKEIAVRRHAQRRQAMVRILSFFGAAQIISGRVLKGAAFLFVMALVGVLVIQRQGIVRPAFDGLPELWKLALVVPIGVVVYALSVRDGFKGDA